MNDIKGLSDKNRFLLQEFIGEIRTEAYAEGFEAGKTFGQWEGATSTKPVLVKSANQQRAELIEKAKKFVESSIENYFCFGLTTFEFVVNAEKRTVVALGRGINTRKVYKRGRAICHPDEVFNAEIGKAIALARALKIDIPVEFLGAVQPTEKVVGMVVIAEWLVKGERVLVASGQSLYSGFAHIGSPVGEEGTIIDDTNAQYEVVS